MYKNSVSLCSPLRMLPSMMYFLLSDTLSLSIYRPHKCGVEILGKICGLQCRPSWVIVETLQYPSLSSGFAVALSRHFLLVLSKSVCRDKVYECHDISAAPMSSAFVASFVQQCGLTVIFVDCRDKLFIVATNILCLLLCICHNRAMKCRDKVQLTLSHNC